MFKKLVLHKQFEYLFYSVIVLYCSLLVFKANLGVIDDHELVNTLLQGKTLPMFVNQSIGRFYPLDGYELNIISKFSVSAIAFYLYNTVQFIIAIFLLYKILIEVIGTQRKNIVYLSILFLIFAPGFITAWFRLLVPERSEFFWFIIFLYVFLRYQKNQIMIFILINLIAGNIALYYKEPAFLMLGSFSFFHLLLGWNELNSKQKIVDYLLILSSIIFIIVYYFVVYINKGPGFYGTTTINPILSFAKNIFNYGLSDPLIIFLMFPLVLYRIYIIIKNKKGNYLYDAMLFSSIIYVLVFFKLNMFAPHYLLPAYAFGFFPVLHFFIDEKLFKHLIFKTLIVVASFFIIFSSLPTGLHLMSYYKNVPRNFQNTLTFLSSYISDKSKDGQKISIFFDGVNRNGGEVHISFIKYLEFRGLKSNQFDIKSDEDDNGVLPIIPPSLDSPYTIHKQITGSKIAVGDLVIISPYTTKYVGLNKKEISAMKKQFDLVYHARSFLEIPNVGIKALLKGILRNKRDDLKNTKVMISENIYRMPLDFYVFRKK